jgi:hypothetical protein
MIPAVHHACNHVLGPAPGDEGKVGKLPVMIHSHGVACFFLPTTLELAALNRGEPLCVNLSIDLQKTGFPPISTGIPDEMFTFDKPPAPILERASDLAALLAKHGIIQPAAVEDPEGYDGHETVIRIGRAFEELRAVPAPTA